MPPSSLRILFNLARQAASAGTRFLGRALGFGRSDPVDPVEPELRIPAKAWLRSCSKDGKVGWAALVQDSGATYCLTGSPARAGQSEADWLHAALARACSQVQSNQIEAIVSNFSAQADLSESSKALSKHCVIVACHKDEPMSQAALWLARLHIGETAPKHPKGATGAKVEACALAKKLFGRQAMRDAKKRAPPARAGKPSSGRAVICVDGSSRPESDSLGWGAVAYTEDGHAREVIGCHRGAEGRGKSYDAEVLAIVRGLEMLPLEAASKVVIRGDCKSALEMARRSMGASDGGKSWHGPECASFGRMARAAAGRQLSFEWVRGHSGDIHNEAADMLASLALGVDLPQHPRSMKSHPRALAAKIAKRSRLAN